MGVFPVVAHLLAPLTVERLQASHPDLRIELREGLEQQLLPALRAGELDCIVGRLVVEGADADLQCEILYEEATAAVCGPSHPLATRSRLGGAELDRYRWVLPSRNAALYSLVASAVAARGAFRRSRWNRAPFSPSCRCCSARRCCRPCRCGWRALARAASWRSCRWPCRPSCIRWAS